LSDDVSFFFKTIWADQDLQPETFPFPPLYAPSASAQDSKDITLTGCLVQGSSPTVFVLENAKLSTAPAGDKGKSYVVVVSGAADLKPHLDHQVRIVGGESIAAASADRKEGEASFPRLNARTVTMVANTCPA
jgi:hypothetical protein